MYGPTMDHACPNCTSILDALDGEARHVTQRASLVVIAKSPIARVRAHAQQRGWRALRLLSSAGISYNADYRGENAEGKQNSALNVFTLKGGVVRHRYGSEMHDGPSEPARTPATSIPSGRCGICSISRPRAVAISAQVAIRR